MASFMP